MIWDVFISHASEDKETVAKPLSQLLEEQGLRVWLDEAQLQIGDSLRTKIDEGLGQSRFGIVILSEAFFAKQWPQRELNALLAREDLDGKTILPVWHGLTKRDIIRFSPILADRLAALTDMGLATVAQKIVSVTGSPLKRTDAVLADRYSSDFDFPIDRIVRSRAVIRSLCDEITWRHLAIKRAGWMLSTSTTVIDVLYDLMAPLVEFRVRSYALRRSISVFTRRARFQFGILDAALAAIFNDLDVAALSPRIAYTPRVPDWQTKRATNPQRYWWQGISPERFDEAGRFFLQTTQNRPGTNQLVSVQVFREQYRAVAASSDKRSQQALGLLANPLYGFTPGERPVYWRLLVIIGRLYDSLLGNTTYDSAIDSPTTVDEIFRATDATGFPYHVNIEPSRLFEPFTTTFDVSSRYLETFTIPKLRLCLEAAREQRI